MKDIFQKLVDMQPGDEFALIEFEWDNLFFWHLPEGRARREHVSIESVSSFFGVDFERRESEDAVFVCKRPHDG